MRGLPGAGAGGEGGVAHGEGVTFGGAENVLKFIAVMMAAQICEYI